MFPSNIILGVFFIFQLCVGVTGNLLLFMLYVYSFLVKTRFRKPIDPIFMHLMIVNIFTIIFAVISQIMSSFGVPKFLDDVGCKVVLFVYRVARGLSISTTSILSTFQAVTIIPSNSMWAWLKPKLSTFTLYYILLSWLINLLLCVQVIESVVAKINHTDPDNGHSHAYCRRRSNKGKPEIYLSVIIMADIVFMTLMLWTSIYMVTLLYRHRKRAQHLRRQSLSSQPPPEHKATHSILLLVSCFVFFYSLNNIVILYGFYAPVKIPILEKIDSILTTCYPTISPFLIMKNNKFILQFISSFSVVRITCFQSAPGG